MQRKRGSITRSMKGSRKGSSRPLSPTAFDEVAEDRNHSDGYPLMDGTISTSDFDPETHNPRLVFVSLNVFPSGCIYNISKTT